MQNVLQNKLCNNFIVPGALLTELALLGELQRGRCSRQPWAQAAFSALGLLQGQLVTLHQLQRGLLLLKG